MNKNKKFYREKYQGLRLKLLQEEVYSLSDKIFSNIQKIPLWDKNSFHVFMSSNEKKEVETNVANAWSSFQSSKSVLESIRSQVTAAEIANEGITLEYESGSNRTTLEVIQSRTILLNSRINLASAERNFLISQFDLLSAVGRLTAKHLNLKQ